MNHHHHVFSYTETERRKRQNPEAILEMAGLKKGMRFIDSGCNDGFFTLPAARIVGGSGKIYAIDIDNEALLRLKRKLDSEGINNTEIINQPSEEVLIEDAEADIVFFGIVLHDFYDPLKVLTNSKQMLKAGGHIFDFDWQKKVSLYGPPYQIRFSPEQMKQLAAKAGLTVGSITTLDDDFYSAFLK